MPIQFYNSLTKRKETFEPIAPPRVTMYNCGPTVYDYAHIGNFRAFVFADVLRRFLELMGHEVDQVMNLTDVGHMTEDDHADGGGEDKMDKARRRLLEAKKAGTLPPGAPDDIDPSDPYQIAEFYINAFLEDARALNIKVASEFDASDASKTRMPRATKHVQDMLAMIQQLIIKKHAYVGSDGAVYYDVQSFEDYGKLSGNTLDQLRGGAGGRVNDATQAIKKHPADFLLWKPDASHLMKWDPAQLGWDTAATGVTLGEGYPGWHIECSAMARAILKTDVIDIHTGGEDNIFPHHECEIAQTRGVTDQPHFARYWMHTRFLLVEGEKMSKSKGNFFTLRDVMDGKVTGRATDPSVVRLELLKAHYRSNANFTAQGLRDSAKNIERIRTLQNKLFGTIGDPRAVEVDLSHPLLERFTAALSDDLNMSGALGELNGWLGDKHSDAAESLAALRSINQVIGLGIGAPAVQISGHMIEAFSGVDVRTDQVALEKCQAIDAARAAKDFATADGIRAELIDAGYEVTTTKEGTVARKKLA